MRKDLLRVIINYKILLLNLILLVQPRGIQTQDEIADEMNTTEVLPEELNITIIPEEAMQLRDVPKVYTAGNTMCRPNKVCNNEDGTLYKWCYTDYSNNWDYCCTGGCDFYEGVTMRCDSGPTWQYCGNGDKKDIQGRPCLASHPCGMHQEAGNLEYYWCYVDLRGNWGRCCEPWNKCRKYGEMYDWCWTGRSAGDCWQECKP